MNGLINVIQVIMNSSNAPVQLIKPYLNDVRKKIYFGSSEKKLTQM